MDSKGKELFDAAYDGDLDKVKQLLLEGANVSYRDHDGWTPCASAAAWGHTAIVKILLTNGAYQRSH